MFLVLLAAARACTMKTRARGEVSRFIAPGQKIQQAVFQL
jgi:hypothetical protein